MSISARLAFLITLAGCTPDYERPRPAFSMGQTIEAGEVVPAMQPVVEFAQPGNPAVLGPNQRFDCVARLTLTPGDRLPSTIIALIRDRGMDCGSLAMLPDKKEGDSYVFRGQGFTPVWPKSYQLIIQAAYLVAREHDDGKATSPDRGKYKIIYKDSAPVKVTVKR